jgi:predicted CopG family antitoxin
MIDRNELLKELKEAKEEQRLRKVVRSLLENYLAEKQEKVMLEENRLRGVIRSLIKEVSADVPDEQPQRSTGINVLEDTLKVIIPIVEDAYKGLTTSKEQRDSFRAHILNAVENSLAPVDITAGAEGSQEENEEELEEEINLDIDVEEDRFIPVRDQDQPEEEVSPEDQDSFQDLSGMNVTGRNFAATTFNKIENQIQDAYESLADEEDRKLYKEYMLTNLKLYFDRFEEELQPTLPEPESPDYNK